MADLNPQAPVPDPRTSMYHDLMPSVSDRDLSKSTTTPLNQSVNQQSTSMPHDVPPSGSEVPVEKGKLARLKDRLLRRTPQKNPALASKTSNVGLTVLSKVEAKAAAKAEAAQAKAESQKAEKFNLTLEWGKTAVKLADAQTKLNTAPSPDRNPEFAAADRFGDQAEVDTLSSQLKKLEKQFGRESLSDDAKRLAKEYGRADLNVNKRGISLEERSAYQEQLGDSYRKLKDTLSHPTQVSGKPVPTPEDIRKADAARIRPSTRELLMMQKLNQAATDLVRLTRVNAGLEKPDMQNGQDVTSANMLLAKDTVSELARELFVECGKDKERFAKLSPDIKPDGSLSDDKKTEIKKEVADSKQAAKAEKSQDEWEKRAEQRTEKVIEFVKLTNKLKQFEKALQERNSDIAGINTINSNMKEIQESRNKILAELKKEYGDKGPAGDEIKALVDAAIKYVKAENNNEPRANDLKNALLNLSKRKPDV